MMKRIKAIIKTAYVRLKFYRPGTENSEGNQLVFFVQDGYPQPHPGLVDRFKAIVGLYYIAKQNGFKFRLVYDTPFLLEKYLQPNTYLWNDIDCISKKRKDTKLITYGGYSEVPKLDKSVSQYHCYYYEGLNILRMANIENWEKTWGELFHELFKPSEYLEGLLKKYVPQEPYIAVHVRFVNALDQFEKGFKKKLSDKEKGELIHRCLERIKEISNKQQKIVYVFSDSMRFLSEAEQRGFQTLPIENIGHISFRKDESVHDKTFVDFYTMAKSDKVYSLQGKHAYSSVFSQYAAIVGSAEYEIVEI